MTEGVKDQETAVPEQQSRVSDKELNFRKLESMREQEREARIKAEMEKEFLKKELENLKLSSQPKEIDPFDSLDPDDPYPDASKIKAKFERERQHLKREAEEIAARKVDEKLKEIEKRDFQRRLRQDFRDYDEVVNDDTVAQLIDQDPIFANVLANYVPDEYERRSMLYQRLKQTKPKAEDKPSIKEKVQENQQNPYFVPASAGSPTAVEFDVRSSQARKSAYEKLKAAQRRPIMGGGPAR